MKPLLVILVAAFAAHAACAAGPAATSSAPGASTLKGEVLEVIDVDAYTYLRLMTANGEVWAAVGKAIVNKGAAVTINDPAMMENFHSATLKRTFPTIVFGKLAVAAPAASPANAALPRTATNLGQVHGGVAKPADVVIAKVARVEGPTGRTVAEVTVQRGALKDKPVAIRATVVKVNANVMGKNWVHLRDGSGSPSDGTNDLLATSRDEPKLGEVVVARGVVKTDVDLGSGYSYRVLVENASFNR
jgi:hypothetical protein